MIDANLPLSVLPIPCPAATITMLRRLQRSHIRSGGLVSSAVRAWADAAGALYPVSLS
ncbi:MAG: hypothetical protein ABW175_24240 [Bradyrhizobium sp.]